MSGFYCDVTGDSLSTTKALDVGAESKVRSGPCSEGLKGQTCLESREGKYGRIRRHRIAQVEFKVVQDGFKMRYREDWL